MNDRVDRLRAKLEEPLLVSDAANVRYLSGLASSNAALLVEPERVRLFTDFRYAESARAVEGVEFVEAKRDLYQTLSELLSGRIGFEGTSLTYERYARLHAGGVDPVARYGLVEELRAVKDEDELDSIRRAAQIADIAFERFVDEGDFVGQTERDLAWRMEQFLHDAGADGVSFSVLVASGPNAAKPHTVPGERRLERGETVIVDWGCMVDGYASDCTRTLATGSLPDELMRAYEVCLDAQLAGLEAVRPEPSGPGVDAAARDRIEAGRLRRCVRARARARRRPARARGSAPCPGVPAHAGGRQRGHGRAGHLPLRSRRDPDRGTSSSSRKTAPRS